MIDIIRNIDFFTMSKKFPPKGDKESPCMICGRAAKMDTAYMMRVFCCVPGHPEHEVAVTDAEAEELHRLGQGNGDLGGQLIGANCLKKHPELKPYVTKP